MLASSVTRGQVTSEHAPDAFPTRQLHSNADTAVATGFSPKVSGRRPSSSSSNQQPLQQSGGVRPSVHQADSFSRPNSNGIPPAQAKGATSVQLDTQFRSEDDAQSTQLQPPVAPRKDSPLRTSSRDGRPVSRPGPPTAQSPYLQPPSGRAIQGTSHRPASRQNSQNSPQPQHLPQPPPAAPTVVSGTAGTVSRPPGCSTGGTGGPSFINGARIIQTYCAPIAKPAQPAVVSSTGAPHLQVLTQAKQPSQAGVAVSQVRSPAEQQPQQQQQPRATTAQQQQQQAGPRATTAYSGARSMQRGRQEAGPGAAAGVEAGQSVARPGAPATQGPYPHHPGHQLGSAGGHGPAGVPVRDSEVNATSFGYDDIPEEDDESASPVVSNVYTGLTLDQYMQRMVTTPASAAATSGLGASADSEESAPCSPGNASTRTEEDDLSCNSPRLGGPSSLGLGRGSVDCDSRDRSLRSAGRSAGGPAVSPPAGMPRFAASGSRGSATGSAVSTSSSSSSRYQADTMVVPPPRGGAPTRSSTTNQPLGPRTAAAGSTLGRGATGAAAVGGIAGALHDDTYVGATANIDVSSLMMDGDSSDDEQLNPSALLNSPRMARHLTSRASAMAFSNSLDLRPATAAVVSSSASMTRGDPGAARGMAADGGGHHAIIKQVDLGGLSASLFMPNPNSGRDAGSPASSAPNNVAAAAGNDHHAASNPSSPDITVGSTRSDRRTGATTVGAGPSMLRGPSPTGADHPSLPGGGGAGTGGSAAGAPKAAPSPKNPMGAIPPPWGVSAREGAFGGGSAGEGAGGAGSLQALAARPLSSRGRPAAVVPGGGAVVDGGVGSPSGQGAAAGAALGRPGSGMKWAKSQPPQKQTDGGPVELPPEARLLAAEAQSMARPPTRQVQSARPPGSRGEIELDPSVWQANIAMQLQRPPSRQKPPPEALHLWTPEQQMGMLSSGGLGRNVGGGRPLGGRPQSAAPTTYRGTRPFSGPSVKAHGLVGDDMVGVVARPPSRQKPPPLSTLLEHDDFPPPPPAGSRRPRPGADQLDVVVSGSEDDDDDDDDMT